MCSNGLNKKGSSSVEKVTVIIILISFLVIAFLILSNVFHFSLFSLGQSVPRLTTDPAVCSLVLINNFTTGTSCIYTLSVSSGSPGLTYTLYGNASQPEKIQSYVAGESSIDTNVTIKKGTSEEYYLFNCNTSGSTSTSVNGFFYSAGGASDLDLTCG